MANFEASNRIESIDRKISVHLENTLERIRPWLQRRWISLVNTFSPRINHSRAINFRTREIAQRPSVDTIRMRGERKRGGGGPVKRLAVIFDNRDRLTTSIVIPNRDDGPVLSSAIILENNGWNEIPWQTSISLFRNGELHYFRQILNMTTFISVKPSGKRLAIGQIVGHRIELTRLYVSTLISSSISTLLLVPFEFFSLFVFALGEELWYTMYIELWYILHAEVYLDWD